MLIYLWDSIPDVNFAGYSLACIGVDLAGILGLASAEEGIRGGVSPP